MNQLGQGILPTLPSITRNSRYFKPGFAVSINQILQNAFHILSFEKVIGG